MRLCGRVCSANSDTMKFISEEAAAPVDCGAATMTVDEPLLEKACNVKERSARDSLSRLTQLASLARLARHSRIAKAAASAPATSSSTRPFHQWSTQHDLELLTAVYSHGLDEAPAKVLTAGTISKLAAAHLAAAATSEPPTPTTPEGAAPVDPRTAAEAELKKKLAARAHECLKNIPDAHGGGAAAAAAAGRLGGGVKRLGKPLSAVPKKSNRGGGSGESGGDSDDDFQAKKKKHKKGDAVNGKGAPAAGRSEPSSSGKFRQIKVDETLTLLHPGSHLPKAAAFRPRDGAASGGADGRVGRLDYPVGYVSVALWNTKKWRCEIVEAGDRPNFRVTADDGSGRPFKSAISPSDVWRQVEGGLGGGWGKLSGVSFWLPLIPTCKGSRWF